MTQIVLLEDEAALREELAKFLCKLGHHVLQAGTLAEFLPLIPQANIAILDVMLPDGSGFDAAKQMRQYSARAGIIMLTARNATQDKLDGLYGGADHYLVKPFRLLEVAAIVDALSRRIGLGWQLDTRQRRLVSPEGYNCGLSVQEMVLFELFCKNQGALITRRTLVEALGHNWLDFDERRLDTLISRLRRRWRDISGQDLPLKTEYGNGYSFGAAIAPL